MARFKNIFKIFTLSSILVTSAIAPIYIAQLKSEQLLNQVHKSVIDTEISIPVNNVQTVEKIKMIIKAQTNKKGVITSH
jgi:hypothetical protein